MEDVVALRAERQRLLDVLLAAQDFLHAAQRNETVNWAVVEQVDRALTVFRHPPAPPELLARIGAALARIPSAGLPAELDHELTEIAAEISKYIAGGDQAQQHCPNCGTQHESKDGNAYCSKCSATFSSWGMADRIDERGLSLSAANPAPTAHGPCCTCQKCGQHYEDCTCPPEG